VALNAVLAVAGFEAVAERAECLVEGAEKDVKDAGRILVCTEGGVVNQS
jgi:hypothetical protein